MDAVQYYIIVFFGTLAVIGAYRSWLLIMRLTSRLLAFIFTRYMQYPLLVRRRQWASVTRLQASFLAVYFAGNSLFLWLRVHNLRAFEQRAALMAVANAVPLFLGGRTNPLADLLGVSLQSYYLAHHWVGRVMIVEALLHAILVMALRPRAGPLVSSGFVVSCSTNPPWLVLTRCKDIYRLVFHPVIDVLVLPSLAKFLFSAPSYMCGAGRHRRVSVACLPPIVCHSKSSHMYLCRFLGEHVSPPVSFDSCPW